MCVTVYVVVVYIVQIIAIKNLPVVFTLEGLLVLVGIHVLDKCTYTSCMYDMFMSTSSSMEETIAVVHM